MIQIGIIDDKSLNRKVIRQNLQEYSEVQIVLEAANGHDFLEQLTHLKIEDQPKLVLVDLDMPGMNGIDTIAIAAIKYPAIKFLVLTIFDDDDKIFNAIKAGASGYLLKDDAPLLLIDAIHNAYHLNGAPMSPAIARKTLQLLKSANHLEHSRLDKTSPIENLLSDREQEILKLLVEGFDYKKIASLLFISPQTVRTHISRIYEKLHINSKAQAILLAHKYKRQQ
ncbi:MAG: response regulator transcription factor [Sediminibacterium sp.]|nr:MAG: LuxR family two component transcriptional [Chitinophagaceae bacterium]MDP1842298.1 response regulator transcription factor [Sediminibacterium sp.]